VFPAGIEPEPISPKPPAWETAAASFAPLIQTIPPWTIGYRMPNSLQIAFSIVFRFSVFVSLLFLLRRLYPPVQIHL